MMRRQPKFNSILNELTVLTDDRVIRHKELNFTVILNPSSGPGTPPLPGNQYIDAISRLNRLPNVKTVGYVGTKGGTRENKTVNDEIETYAGWSRKSGLGLHGIFFDQTPIVDSMEMRHYLKNISATVKHSKAFLEPKMVIHNPGKIPNANLTGPYVDITIVFEGECADIPKHEVMKPELAKLPARRENYGIVVHSVPSKIKWPGLRRIVNSAKKDVEYLYVTDRRENPYDGLSGIWGTFLDLTW